jgi:hypothetical protein
MFLVPAPESSWNENFDTLPHELSTCIPKHDFDLVIRAGNSAGFVNHYDGIRREPEKSREHLVRPLGFPAGRSLLAIRRNLFTLLG